MMASVPVWTSVLGFAFLGERLDFYAGYGRALTGTEIAGRPAVVARKANRSQSM